VARNDVADTAVMRFLQRIGHWLTEPSAAIQDREQRRQVRWLATMLLSLLLLVAALAIVAEVIVQDQAAVRDRHTRISAAALLAIAGLYCLSRTRHYARIGYAVVGLISALIFLAAVPAAGQVYGNLLLYLVVPILLSSVLLPYRVTILLIALQLAAMLAFPLAVGKIAGLYDLATFVFFVSVLIVLATRHVVFTEKKRLADLAETERRYRTLFEEIDDVVLVHDLEGHILDVNDAASRRLGYTRDELLHLKTVDLDAPDYGSGFKERVARQLAEGGLREIGGIHVAKNGRRIVIDSNTKLIHYQGQPAILAVCRDISERVRAEAVLHDSETRTSAILSAIPDLIFRLSADGTVLDYEIGDGQISRYMLSNEILGRRLDEALPPEVASAFRRSLQTTVETQSLHTSEYQLPASDGTPCHFEARSVPLGEDEVLTIVRDITSLKQTQEALRENEARYRSLFEDSPISLWEEDFSGIKRYLDDLRAQGVSDLEPYLDQHPEAVLECIDRLKIIDVNQAALALFGLGEKTGLYEELKKTLSGEAFDVFKRELVALSQGRTRFQRVSSIHIGTGPERTVVVSVSIAPGYEDTWSKVFVSEVDITERQRIAEAEHDQRMLAEALRDTAATVNSTLNLDEVLDRILTNIGRVVPHDAANITLLDGGVARVVRQHGYDHYGLEDFVLALQLKAEDYPSLRRMMETHQPLRVSDTQTDPEWATFDTSAVMRSYVGSPVCWEGQVIGFLNLQSTEPDFFTPAHAERLRAFADQAALAISNARLYAEVHRYTNELEQRVTDRTVDLSVRNAVAETLSSSLDMGEMLNGVLRTTVEQLGVLGGAIYLLGEDSTTLEMAAHWGLPADTLNLVTGIHPGGPDVGLPWPGLGGLSEEMTLVQQTGISAVLNVPIWRQEQVQGVITLANAQPRPWHHEEVRMLDAIGRQIGVAIANARLYAEAVRREARILTILENVVDGLLVFDRRNTLTLKNRAAEALFSFYSTEGDRAGQAAALLWQWLQSHGELPLAPMSTEFALPTLPLTSEAGNAVAAQCRIEGCSERRTANPAWPCWLRPTGLGEEQLHRCAIYQRIPRRAVQAQCAEVRDAADQVLGTVVALHDVTTFRELDELKGRFVSTVSHELRTPLSAALLQISTLLKYYDRFSDHERRTMIGEVQQQAHVLRELIEDILELSRLDARRSLPQKQWFDLVSHCHEVVASMRPAIDEKHLSLDLSQCTGSRYVLVDPNQVMRVLRNLLSNAIKYTPEGGQIALRLEQVGQEVRLSVTDTGIGIALEEQSYIFDRFFRSEGASRMASGTGLGLSITKEIVELHRGRIGLQSTPGKGSTFTVYLPISTDDWQ
jgi:PAS domain S-box-containing protein